MWTFYLLEHKAPIQGFLTRQESALLLKDTVCGTYNVPKESQQEEQGMGAIAQTRV